MWKAFTRLLLPLTRHLLFLRTVRHLTVSDPVHYNTLQRVSASAQDSLQLELLLLYIYRVCHDTGYLFGSCFKLKCPAVAIIFPSVHSVIFCLL